MATTVLDEIKVTLGLPTIAVSVAAEPVKVVSVTQQGPQGPSGNKSTMTITIQEPSLTWTLAHYLNCYPSLTLVDTAGGVMLSTYAYQDQNTIIVSFGAPTSGVAYLN